MTIKQIALFIQVLLSLHKQAIARGQILRPSVVCNFSYRIMNSYRDPLSIFGANKGTFGKTILAHKASINSRQQNILKIP